MENITQNNLAKAELRLAQAEYQITTRDAFFANLIGKLRRVVTTKIQTADTNGAVVRFNPDYVLGLEFDRLVGLYAHEILHPALDHCRRLLGRDSEVWNVACDHEVNWLLHDMQYSLPAGALMSPEYRGWHADSIYAAEMARRPKRQQQDGASDDDSASGSQDGASQDSASGSQDSASGSQDGASQDSASQDGGSQDGASDDDSASGSQDGASDDDSASGSQDGDKSVPSDSESNPSDYGGCGSLRAPSDDETGDPMSESDAAALSADWSVAVEMARINAVKAGLMPGGAHAIIKHSRESEQDWKDKLRDFLTGKGNQFESNLLPPNRRFVPFDLLLAKMRPKGISRLLILVDWSGSVRPYIDAMCTELNTILSDLMPEETDIVYWDTRHKKTDTFGAYDLPITMECSGFGGTNFAGITEYLESEDKHYDAAVFITDLAFEAQHLLAEPDFPLIWCHVANYNVGFAANPASLPFGEYVRIPEHAKNGH